MPTTDRRRRGDGLDFNHAMLYVRRLDRAVGFFSDGLGFTIIEELDGYARLRAPRGNGTIALHRDDPERNPAAGVRLYFEVPDVAAYCATLRRKGIHIDDPPARRSWGWTHAYLTDPDGHELSIYAAGAARFRKTT